MSFRNHPGKMAIGFLAICAIHAPALAGDQATVTVGSDGACDYSSITAAVFNAPAANLLEIRLAKNVSITAT